VGRGREWCCWAHPGTKILKVEIQGLARVTQPTPRPGALQASQAKPFSIQVLVTGGAVSSAVERIDSMFGSWKKLPGGDQPMHPGTVPESTGINRKRL